MKLNAYRLVKNRYRASAWSGEGARRYGGRWNLVGDSVIYFSESLALATLEVLVHLPRNIKLPAYSFIHVQFKGSLIEAISEKELPRSWYLEKNQHKLQAIGSTWLREERSVVLRVPSAIVRQEFNYLINPLHRDFKHIDMMGLLPFKLDERFLLGNPLN